jgi:hypothetical protein
LPDYRSAAFHEFQFLRPIVTFACVMRVSSLSRRADACPPWAKHPSSRADPAPVGEEAAEMPLFAAEDRAFKRVGRQGET